MAAARRKNCQICEVAEKKQENKKNQDKMWK